MTRARKGTTLVETLASIALSGTLLAALGSMATGLARSAREIERVHRWEAGAEAMLRAIHDEIVSGWRPDSAEPGRGTRVTTSEGSLRIGVWGETRGGDANVVYELRRGTGRRGEGVIERRIESWSGVSVSIVLGDVERFGCNREGDVVEVHVRSASGAVRVRRIHVTGGVRE